MINRTLALVTTIVLLACTNAQTFSDILPGAYTALVTQAAGNTQKAGAQADDSTQSASAQNANVGNDGDETLKVTTHEGLIPLLTSGSGRSLYLYLEDTRGRSACYDRCAKNWPPLLAEEQPVAGQGIEKSLLGTTERRDGTRQVTYNGHPLYRYIRDEQPGDVRGQALGEVFYLVLPSGTRVENAAAPEGDVEIPDEIFTELITEGEGVFSNNCAACHGAEGQGQIGPRLAGNSNLDRPEFVATRIISGFPQHGMPAFRDQLSNEEIASTATYVRNSWGNDYGAVTAQMVEELLAQ